MIETKNTKSNINEDNHSTVISEGTIFEGKIQSTGNLVIQGKIHGYVVARSKIHISETGIVEGIITGEEIRISGRAQGKIQAERVLIITHTAKVNATLKSEKLLIEDGADVNNKKIPESPIDFAFGRIIVFEQIGNER